MTLVHVNCKTYLASDSKLDSPSKKSFHYTFRPSNEDILKRIRVIAKQEEFNIDMQAICRFFEMSGQDVRQIINMLQMHRTTSGALTSADINKK